MEAADQLHNLWIGCAKDSLASVFCDIIEYHPMFRGSESWDEALAQLCTLLHDYCDRSGLEKAVIDEISLTKLSIKSITYDFPAAFSKGWANRVGTAFAADFLKNTDVEELESYIGQVCSIGKSTAVHTSTIGLRLLQRLMLHLNAVWSAPEKRGPVYLCSSRDSRDLIVCTPELPIDTGQFRELRVLEDLPRCICSLKSQKVSNPQQHEWRLDFF